MVGSCVLFEDPYVDRLRPINLARATFRITCGAASLLELCRGWDVPLAYHVRPHLRGVIERLGAAPWEEVRGPVLYINAGLVPDRASLDELWQRAQSGEPFLALNDQRITAALCREAFPVALAERSPLDLVSYLLEQGIEPIEDEFPMLEHTFDVCRHHERLLPGHIDYWLGRGAGEEIQPGVFAGKDVKIAPNAYLDATDGPIFIGSGTRIEPFAFIAGPVRIGKNCRILDHAAIKHGTVLGHTVKAGGEIEASIIEPYSNKQHHGFLGHAYVGSWVNLGAGTSNSDLKNTYGTVSVELDGQSVNSQLQFLGCVIGDYTKSAINTSIFTGKLIGVASFLYGFITTNVPSFTNYARSFGQVTEVGVDVAIKTQTRAAARRKVETTAVDATLMRDLFEMTRSERQLSSDQLML